MPPSGASRCCAQFCFAAHFMLLSFFSSLLNNSSQRLKLTLSVTLISATQRLSSQQLCSQQLNSATLIAATLTQQLSLQQPATFTVSSLSLFSHSPSLIEQSMQCKKLGGGI